MDGWRTHGNRDRDGDAQHKRHRADPRCEPKGAAVRLAPPRHQPPRHKAVQQEGESHRGHRACCTPFYRGAIRRLCGGGACHPSRRRVPLAGWRSFEARFRLLRGAEVWPGLVLPASLGQGIRTGGAPWPLERKPQKRSRGGTSPKHPTSIAFSTRPSHAMF